MNNRYLMTLKLITISSPMKRAEYMKKKGIFHHIGERVMITSRKVPLYPNLISIGNNVWLASGVEFITHDVAHHMLNGLNDGNRYQEKIGCIAIGDNVFVGAGSKIMYDVKIGNRVIIAAGAVVTKDVPSGCIIGGVPAKVIGNFDDFVEKRKAYHINYHEDNRNQIVSKECEQKLWKRFSEIHSS